jgi:hypothetical protein
MYFDYNYYYMRIHKIVVGSAILLFSIPLLVIALQTPQEIRQHAQAAPTPTTPPRCAAAGGQPNTGVCAETTDGCLLGEEDDEGQLDCATGQTCCALAVVPAQCAAQSNGQTFCSTATNCTDLYKNQALAQFDCQTGTICCRNPKSPTSTPKPNQPTVTAKPTPSTGSGPTPTVPASSGPTPTLAPEIGTSTIEFLISLHGIGNSGDNASTNSSLSNKSPLRTTRQFTIHVDNSPGTYVKDVTLSLSYNQKSGVYIGDIQLVNITSGYYNIKLKTDGYLEKTLPQEGVPAGAGGFYEISLSAGDMNGDNRLDALDYNAIISCYNVIVPTDSCNASQKQLTDLNDDGFDNGVDYNLFLRETINGNK